MIRVFMLALALAFAACGESAPPPAPAEQQSYSILHMQPDPSGGLAVNIKVSAAAGVDTIKTAAESVISERKAQYSRIIVNTFADGENPVAVSKLEGGRVSHQFTDETRGKQVRIPTH
jgi:hypothetical protein